MIEAFALDGVHMMTECTPKSATCVLQHSCTLLQLHVFVHTLSSCSEFVKGTVETCLMACLSNRQSSAPYGCGTRGALQMHSDDVYIPVTRSNESRAMWACGCGY